MNNADGITRELDSKDRAEKGAELLADANAMQLSTLYAQNPKARSDQLADAEKLREQAYQQLAAVALKSAERAVKEVRDRNVDSQRGEGLSIDADRHIAEREKFLDAKLDREIVEKESRKLADFGEIKKSPGSEAVEIKADKSDRWGHENTLANAGPRNQQQEVDSTDLMQDMRETKPPKVPETITDRYAQAGKNFHEKTGEQEEPAFSDRGTKFSTSRDDSQVAADMVEMARARGWHTVELKGSEEFRRAAWVAAEEKGIQSKGYRPTDKEIETAANKRSQVEVVETTHITRDGELPQALRERAQTDPEALKAVAIHQLAKEVSKQLLKDPTLQARFEHVVERRLDEHLKGERPLPDVQIRNDRDKERGDETRDQSMSR